MSNLTTIGVNGTSFEDLPHEKIQKRLRTHPDFLEIDFAGEEDLPYFIGKYSFEVIRHKGHDPAEIFPFDKSEEELMEEGLDGHSDRAAKMLWGGLVTFDHDLDLAEVEMLMSMGEMTGLYKRLVQHAMSVEVPGMPEAGNA